MYKELLKRPLVILFFGMICGIIINNFPFNFIYTIVFVFLLKDSKALVFTFLIALLLGWVIGPKPKMIDMLSKSFFQGQLYVKYMPKHTQYNDQYILEFEGKRYLLKHPINSTYKPSMGDIVYAKGTVHSISSLLIDYWSKKNVYLEIRPTLAFYKLKDGHLLWSLAMDAHQSFLNFTNRYLSPKVSGLIKALCFNDRSDLPTVTQKALLFTGTIHIVSTSGFHVIILGASLLNLFRYFCFPRWINILLLGLCLLIYVAATGLQAPAIRAYCMLMLFYTAYLWKREPDSISGMALAGIIYILWSPNSIYELGFQLSFLCTTALILYMNPPYYEKITSVKSYFFNKLEQLFKSSTIAFITSSPLLAYYFMRIPIVSILANILLIPILPFIMITTFTAWTISFLIPSLSMGFAKLIIEPLSGWVIAIVELLGSQSWAAIEIPPISAIWILATYVTLSMIGKKQVKAV